jgi:hypothetical protein
MRRAVLALLAIVTGCSSSAVSERAATTTIEEPHILTVTITLGGPNGIVERSDGSCTGKINDVYGAFAGPGSWQQDPRVFVRREGALTTVLAAEPIGYGVYTSKGDCRYRISISDLSRESAYEVEIPGTHAETYSYEQLEADRWAVAFLVASS